MQSDVTMNPRASDDSSSDVEAEISDGDGFLPIDRPHTVAEDEGNVIHCLSFTITPDPKSFNLLHQFRC